MAAGVKRPSFVVRFGVLWAVMLLILVWLCVRTRPFSPYVPYTEDSLEEIDCTLQDQWKGSAYRGRALYYIQDTENHVYVVAWHPGSDSAFSGSDDTLGIDLDAFQKNVHQGARLRLRCTQETFRGAQWIADLESGGVVYHTLDMLNAYLVKAKHDNGIGVYVFVPLFVGYTVASIYFQNQAFWDWLRQKRKRQRRKRMEQERKHSRRPQ